MENNCSDKNVRDEESEQFTTVYDNDDNTVSFSGKTRWESRRKINSESKLKVLDKYSSVISKNGFKVTDMEKNGRTYRRVKKYLMKFTTSYVIYLHPMILIIVAYSW